MAYVLMVGVLRANDIPFDAQQFEETKCSQL